ncbi:hypothetical protein MG290_01635 [Flavobacterium sp. CBA20B-1]|uniref:hypothetical protein n=1 Tax=unclassified Flavobacterium TaxID=196869 RepID=UPI0022247D5C|nr:MULTISPECIES: hypothetical protein [unclassified Flavobacterium]WCM42397.1 hypothetical protein MG290_01635 [Flavobacterium sp. CBA20B-1]
MGVTASLNNEKQGFDTGNDTIVIPRVMETVIGGRTLDTTGFTPEIIKAGTVVIKEDSTGDHKPMPLNSNADAYEALPAGHSFVGVVISTVDAKKPFVGICVRGTVNEIASPYPPTTAIKNGLAPLIRFIKE